MMKSSAQKSRSVFIGWAGHKSGFIAQALRAWLRCLSPDIDPWVSNLDLPPGGLWPVDLAARLQQTRAGILCITKDNTDSRWLNFEAGALARSVESSLVIPYGIDIEPSSIPNPIGHYQGVAAKRQDTLRMIERLFTALEVTYDRKHNTFAVFWPLLSKAIVMSASMDPSDPDFIESGLKPIEDAAVAQRSTIVKDIVISPLQVSPGGSLELEYPIETEVSDFNVWLGAAICGAEGEWFPQPDQDREVKLNLGIQRFRRKLAIPGHLPAGDYAVNAEVWIGPLSNSRCSYPILKTRRWPVRTIRVDSNDS
jgi:hypothetical protein